MSRVIATMIILLSLLSMGFQTETPQLVISTAYPSQEVRAGESLSISFDLKAANMPAQIVELEVRDTPEGWRASFQGGGRVVHSVYVDPAASRSVNLSVEVPEGTAHGTYGLTVIARGQGVQAQLPLELIVGESEPAQLAVEPELPVLKGTPSSTFSYRLKVKNDSDQDTLVNFEVEAPLGFDVIFKKAAGGQELASLPIKAGQTENVDVSVRPVAEIPAGEYPFRVHIQSELAAGSADLVAVISGKPELMLSTPDGRLSGQANAGQETPLELLVRNDGTAPLADVRLEASPPAQWSVTFEPELISGLEPGQEINVTARIKPPDQAIAGDYVVTLRAVPENGGNESAEFRITVLTSTVWGAVGLVLIAAALGVVALAVARFGRR